MQRRRARDESGGKRKWNEDMETKTEFCKTKLKQNSFGGNGNKKGTPCNSFDGNENKKKGNTIFRRSGCENGRNFCFQLI
jgi:hypothetical protein